MIDLFVKGGGFMWPILVCLIIGLAVCLERFFSLTRASISTRKFLEKVKNALKSGGVNAALDVCSRTRGPVAAIFHAGLMRSGQGIEAAEKAVTTAGSIEMAFLERGLIWLQTVVSLAPMLGFTGTVQGMIMAFDAIAAVNDISPTIVAEGISVALLTTLFGLIVAMIIQAAHSFFVAKIDSLIIQMEESSVELIDSLIELEQSES